MYRSTKLRVTASLDHKPSLVGAFDDWPKEHQVAPAKWRAAGDRIVTRDRVWFENDFGSLHGKYSLTLRDSNQVSRALVQLPTDDDRVVEPKSPDARLLQCGLLVHGLKENALVAVSCESAAGVKLDPPEFLAKPGVVRQFAFFEGCEVEIVVDSATGDQTWKGVPEPGGLVEIHLE